MKKAISLIIVMAVIMLLLPSIVSATDLSSAISAGNDKLGGKITYDTSYDDENDVTKVLVTLLVDEASIETALKQTSGLTSQLSMFYFELNPHFESNTIKKFRKAVTSYGETRTNKTLAEAITELKGRVDQEEVKDYSVVWPTAFKVEYNAGSGWVTSDTEGNGSTSIKQDLLNKLNVTESELVYGENYRFAMNTQYTQVWLWDLLNDAGEHQGYETITIDYAIKFPVSGKVGNEQVMYTSVNQAIEDGVTEITVNTNIEEKGNSEGNLVIPQGVTITVSDGATLTLKQGATLQNNGTILGTVKTDEGTKTYYNVTTSTTTNGSLMLNKNAFAVGDTVTITVSPNQGFKLEQILGVTEITKVSDTEYTFVMPNADVVLSANFVATSEELPPVVQPVYYDITIDSTIKNGKIETDKIRTIEGDTIIITVKADEGYVLNKLSGVDGIEKITDITYKFTMPAENIELSAEFVEEVIQNEPDDPTTGTTDGTTDNSTDGTLEGPTDKEPTDEESKGELDETSDTGIESVALYVFITLAVVSTIALIVIRKRK